MSKKKKLTPRANFIKNSTVAEIAECTWNALMLASSHDPDHENWLKRINNRLEIIDGRLDLIERQLRRIGAPQYRRVKRGILAEIVRGPKSAKKVKDYTL